MNGYEKSESSEADTQHGRYLTFAVEKEEYGIEIRCVMEIVGIQEISSIPECADYIKGIINLRGSIIPVLDMRLRLKKEPIPYNDRTCIIVVEIDGITAGLIVDNVAEVVTIAEADIVAPPQMNSGTQYRYINGIAKTGEKIKLLLDCKKLILQGDIEKSDLFEMEEDHRPLLEADHALVH